MKTLAIIGGGAAGLVAAVAAADARDAAVADACGSAKTGRSVDACGSAVGAGDAPADLRITVYESADRVGKSILATGNGRCNFSNASIDATCYHNADFVGRALASLGENEVVEMFASLGLLSHEEAEGRLYPLSNKASSVLDVLRLSLQDSGVIEKCGAEIVGVDAVGERYVVKFADGATAIADSVIVACGGKTARTIMPAGLAYVDPKPLLGPLETDTVPLRGLNNIRVRCSITLFAAGQSREPKAREVGEVLFRDYGVSGIAVFNLSRFAQRGDVLALDLVPNCDENALTAELERRVVAFGERSAVELCAGMLLAPLARAVCRQANIAADGVLATQDVYVLAQALKHFELTVKGIGDARQCQVMRGGFSVDAFDPETMQARGYPGLYMAGEALDVDAPCGGFNLHWAWASGTIAGRASAKRS